MSVTTIDSQPRHLTGRQLKSRFSSLRLWMRRQHASKTFQVFCESGVVWVTVENDAHDYFVRAGETRCFSSPGRIVAQGLGEASFRVEKCVNPNIEYSKL